MAADRTDAVAGDILGAVAALRAEQPARAVELLEGALADPSFRATAELADVRARAWTLLAQAYLAIEPVDERNVERALGEALTADPAAEAACAELRGRLLDQRQARLEAEARLARAGRLAAADLQPLLEKVRDPDRRLELMVQKAQADVQCGDTTSGERIAHEVLATATVTSTRVFARLVIATAAPQLAAQQLLAAHAEADAASEFNLVGAVARTADILGISMPTQLGPRPTQERPR